MLTSSSHEAGCRGCSRMTSQTGYRVHFAGVTASTPTSDDEPDTGNGGLRHNDNDVMKSCCECEPRGVCCSEYQLQYHSNNMAPYLVEPTNYVPPTELCSNSISLGYPTSSSTTSPRNSASTLVPPCVTVAHGTVRRSTYLPRYTRDGRLKHFLVDQNSASSPTNDLDPDTGSRVDSQLSAEDFNETTNLQVHSDGSLRNNYHDLVLPFE